jgi:hypothetical protein
MENIFKNEMKSNSIAPHAAILENGFIPLARILHDSLTKMNAVGWKEVNAGGELKV